MKSIKMSDYFQIRNPSYITLQLVPSTSNRNYDTELIAQTIAQFSPEPVLRRLKKENKIFYDKPPKIVFITKILADDVFFYLLVPSIYQTLFTTEAMQIWKRVTIKELVDLPKLNGDYNYALVYTKEDALSLKYNKKTNTPLNNIMMVKSFLKEDDEVNIINNFIPINQNTWYGKYRTTIDKLKKDIPIDRDKTKPSYLIQLAFSYTIVLFDGILDMVNSAISNEKVTKEKVLNTQRLELLTQFTKKKEISTVVKTQTIINTKQASHAKIVVDSYNIISGDNKLEGKQMLLKKTIQLDKYVWSGVPSNTMSTGECNNLIQLAGRELMEQMNIMTKTDVLINPAPTELTTGNIPVGDIPVDKKPTVYFPTDFNFSSLALLLLGSQGEGKTNFIANYALFAHKIKECNIVIDYVKNCECSDAIYQVLGSKNVDILDLSKKENLQSFAFNELVIPNGAEEFEIFEIASLKSEQTLAFINAINKDGIPLTTNMRRMVESACKLVYLRNNTSIGDVIKCLTMHQVRYDYIQGINKFSDEGKEFLQEYVDTMRELDKIDRVVEKNVVISETVVGTKRNEIEGILDRINLLKENINCKYMLNLSPNNNYNFVKAMEEGRTILIKMPEHKFSSIMVKNVLTTFFTSKIVLCAKLRGSMHEKPNKVNVFYDEIYQAPIAMGVLKETLSQLRKFGTKIIISAHHIDQVDKDFKTELIGSGASFMLFRNCDENTFKQLADKFAPYEVEDLLNLKQFHTLNLIRTRTGNHKFITHLPKKVF